VAFKVKSKKMFHSDDGTEAKVNICFSFVGKAAVNNDRARARARNEGNRSEVENYVVVFIDYGLTGPRARRNRAIGVHNGGER